jgi:dihydrodipicolinate synthase/N-acetylneuraminate lyase
LTYTKITGLIPILQTPFDSKSRIDTDSLRKIVDFNIENGVDGLGIALASELQKLNEPERNLVLKTVVDQTNGRVPVVMNAGANGNDLAIYYCKQAQELGADAVMVTPPAGGGASLSPEAARQYFRDVENAVDISVALQDVQFAPIAPDLVAEMAAELPGRIAATVDATKGTISVLGGGGATFLMEELARGSEGTMPFCSTPVEFTEIFKLYRAGKIEEAITLFNTRIAPIGHLIAQAPELAIGIHKEILKKRGLIDSTHVRAPSILPDQHTKREIEAILERVIV